MTLLEARRARDYLRKHGYKCTVPLGHGGPNGDGYFLSVKLNGKAVRFYTTEEWNAHAMKQNQHVADYVARYRVADTRSPLDRMIDEACGVKS